MTNNLTVKYYMKVECNETDMTGMIQISKKQYDKLLNEQWPEVKELTKDDEDCGPASCLEEPVETDQGNCIMTKWYYWQGLTTVYLYKYKCKPGYHFTTRR